MEQANNGKDGIFSEGTPTCCAPEELAISRCLYISDAIISQGRVAKIKKKKKRKSVFTSLSRFSRSRKKSRSRKRSRRSPRMLQRSIHVIIYSLTDDKNRSVESRRWPVAIFTRVSCNDKLISPSISFPEFRLSLRPRGNDIIHVCIYVHRIYALTFQQRERIFPRDLDPRTRWNPVTGYPVSPILAAPPDYSLKPNTRRQTIPCLAAFSVYISRLRDRRMFPFVLFFDADFFLILKMKCVN